VLQDTSKLETAFLARENEESTDHGLWFYHVVEPAGIVPRRLASYDESFKTSGKLMEGEVVVVDRRLVRDWTTWLRLRSSADWVWDISPKDARVSLVELTCDFGPWEYEAASVVGVLQTPSLDLQRHKPTAWLKSGELVTVLERYGVAGRTVGFMRLAENRGWVRDDRGLDGGQMRPALVPYGAPWLPAPAGEESGSWDYIVGSVDGATSSRGTRLNEGDVVRVIARRPAELAMLLCLEDGSWVADTVMQGKSMFVSMVRVHVERGRWAYRVVAKRGIGVRARSTLSDNAKCVRGPNCGEHVDIEERVICGSTAFLKMSDGRGWLFDVKKGKQLMILIEGSPVDTSKLDLCDSMTETASIMSTVTGTWSHYESTADTDTISLTL